MYFYNLNTKTKFSKSIHFIFKHGCSSASPIWKLFQCGHSFHVDCNLPALSECPVCKIHLKSKIQDLSRKANESIKDLTFCVDDGAELEGEIDQHENSNSTIDEDLGDVYVDQQEVLLMIQQISSWPRPSPPRI